MIQQLFIVALLWFCSSSANAFSHTTAPRSTTRSTAVLYAASSSDTPHNDIILFDFKNDVTNTVSRRGMLASTVGTFGMAFAASSANAASDDGSTPKQLFQLPSGLKYIDIKEGTGPTPSYGQLCSIAFKGYIKLPASKENANPQPQLFGQSPGYLLKHGNGRTIPGLDQGLHTLRVGGTRRLIIPAKLGYIQSGLGPLPPSPWGRYRLNSLLDDMVRLQGGNLVFEVTLLSAIDDEADQGYYNDASLSPEDFEKLRTNLQRQAQAAKGAATQ